MASLLQCIEKINKAEAFVDCFDESFNKKLKQGQMDLLIRFWNQETDRVEVTYLTSELLGHQRAEDLLQALEKGMAQLDNKKMIQISMDGPNVNWKVMKLFFKEKYQRNPEDPQLLETGSCGIHTVHGAYKTGCEATGIQDGSWIRF